VALFQEGYIIPQHITVFRGVEMMAQGTKFGVTRLPNPFTLNLGLEKSFKLACRTTATFFLDVYNVTNGRTALKVETALGPANNLPLQVINPGLLQFGLRVNF
jgi:hypothetical protein